MDPDGRSIGGKLLGYGCYLVAGIVLVGGAAVTTTGQVYLTAGAVKLSSMLLAAGTAVLTTDVINDAVKNSPKTTPSFFKGNSSSAAAPSPLPPDPDDDENLEYESNPKHHQNARGNASQEPKNAKEMFEKSVKDPTKDGTRWYKDKNGNFHRFKEHHNGKYHWNGSTNTGTRLENVPIELRRNLPKGEF